MKNALLRSFLTSALCLSCIAAGYGQLLVKGKVLDAENNTPLVGCTVVEEGTNNGAVTNTHGDFTIRVKSADSELRFVYMGYKERLMNVWSRSEFRILLEPEHKHIDDVVVIGYGTVRKSDLTGSVAKIGGEEIAGARQLSIDQSIAGRIAGVQVSQNSGEPGAGLNIQIRGVGSINASSAPLYVVDGFPYERGSESNALQGLGVQQNDPLSFLNPNDIESIEVLKDASATAIYGSRGANGVVLVTTKSGKEGAAAKVTVDTYWGFATISKKLDVLNGSDFAKWMYDRESYNPTPNALYVQGGQYGTPVDYSGAEEINWQDRLYRTAVTQNYNIALDGGWKGGSYAASVGWTDQQGILPGSEFERFNVRLRASQQVRKWLRLEAGVIFSKTRQDGVVGVSGSAGASVSAMQQLITFRPINVPWSIEEDDPDWIPEQEGLRTNPEVYLRDTQKEQNSNNTNINLAAVFTIAKGLTLRSSYALRMNNGLFKEYHPATVEYGYITNGRGFHESLRTQGWVNENILTYNAMLGKKHRLTVMGGITFEQFGLERYSQQGQEYPFDTFGMNGMTAAQKRPAPAIQMNRYSLMSFLGRINYTFDNRYLFTVSFRADGSSKFSRKNRFSYFPSAAFAWRAGEEKFIRDLDVFHDLKLRISYGMTGNQGIPAYSTLDQMAYSYYSYNTGGGLNPGTAAGHGMVQGVVMGNRDLRWETTTQYNAGIDMAFFKGRLSLTGDYYFKDTRDMLMNDMLPHSTGYRSMYRNIGRITNSGVELTLSSVNIRKRGFEWSSDFNISFNKNEVRKLGKGGSYTVTAPTIRYTNQFIVMEGQPIGTMWGYRYDGVYQYSDFLEFYNADGTLKPIEECRQMLLDATGNRYTAYAYAAGKRPFTLKPGVPKRFGSDPLPGMVKFESLTGADNVTEADRTVIGQSHPDFYGSLNNTFKYKNVDLSLLVSFSYGNQIFVSNYYMVSGFQVRNSLYEIYDNTWFPHREGTKYPNPWDAGGRDLVSSMNVEDASYIKIRDITLGYTFSNRLLSRAGIRNLRFYVSAQNFFTFTRYKWVDPETAYRDPLASGFENFSYPTSKRIVAGCSITF